MLIAEFPILFLSVEPSLLLPAQLLHRVNQQHVCAASSDLDDAIGLGPMRDKMPNNIFLTIILLSSTHLVRLGHF